MKTRISTAGKTLPDKIFSGQTGFTYIVALAAIVIVGIVIAAGHSSTWYLQQSNREAELLFRGEAYRRAIGSYYQASPGVKAFPKALKQLLSDPRLPDSRPHIRKLYNDPMARGEDKSWQLIRAKDGGIAGVVSKSEDEPLKKAGFTKEHAKFANAKSYTEWEFEYKPKKTQPSAKTRTPVTQSGSPILKTN